MAALKLPKLTFGALHYSQSGDGAMADEVRGPAKSTAGISPTLEPAIANSLKLERCIPKQMKMILTRIYRKFHKCRKKKRKVKQQNPLLRF
ncbi:hypothetical protein BJX64DRAFT_246439, partial [Aspergillus heterothallicus]